MCVCVKIKLLFFSKIVISTNLYRIVYVSCIHIFASGYCIPYCNMIVLVISMLILSKSISVVSNYFKLNCLLQSEEIHRERSREMVGREWTSRIPEVWDWRLHKLQPRWYRWLIFFSFLITSSFTSWDHTLDIMGPKRKKGSYWTLISYVVIVVRWRRRWAAVFSLYPQRKKWLERNAS